MANEKEWQQDISTTVDAHTNTIADHEERITANKVKLDEHETRIDNIETTSDVGQFATRIRAVEEKNTEQDSAIDTLKKNVSDNLQTAKQYTDTKLADYATKTENSNTLEQAKQYANNKADDTLENAKQYTDTKLADYATKTENSDTLEQAKQYANSKADDALSQAKTDASQKYLTLAGGNLSGDLWGVRPSTLREQGIGLRDSVSGTIYMFSNSTNRGIYAINPDNSGSNILDINNSGRVTVHADVIHLNGTDITVG